MPLDRDQRVDLANIPPIVSPIHQENIADFVAALFQPNRPGAERWLASDNSKKLVNTDAPSAQYAAADITDAEGHELALDVSLVSTSALSSLPSAGRMTCILRRYRFPVAQQTGAGVLRGLVFISNESRTADVLYKILEDCASIQFA